MIFLRIRPGIRVRPRPPESASPGVPKRGTRTCVQIRARYAHCQPEFRLLDIGPTIGHPTGHDRHLLQSSLGRARRKLQIRAHGRRTQSLQKGRGPCGLPFQGAHRLSSSSPPPYQDKGKLKFDQFSTNFGRIRTTLIALWQFGFEFLQASVVSVVFGGISADCSYTWPTCASFRAIADTCDNHSTTRDDMLNQHYLDARSTHTHTRTHLERHRCFSDASPTPLRGRPWP